MAAIALISIAMRYSTRVAFLSQPRLLLVFSAIFLMQRSPTFLLCLIDLKAEQKERDDRVVMHASSPMGARHRNPPIRRLRIR